MAAITRRSFRRAPLDPNPNPNYYHPPSARMQTLHIANQRDSIGLDSLSSSVPPPCYTSQRDVASSIATGDGGHIVGDDALSRQEGDWEEENGDGDRRSIVISAGEYEQERLDDQSEGEEQGSVSMHSCREVLPSPYSTEDLFAGMQPHPHRGPSRQHQHTRNVQEEEQDFPPPSIPARSCCVHGYTHTHSQCTVDGTTLLSPGAAARTYESHDDAHSPPPPPPLAKTTRSHSRSQSHGGPTSLYPYISYQTATTTANANANGPRRTRHLSNSSTETHYPSQSRHPHPQSQSGHGHGHSHYGHSLHGHGHDYLSSPPPLTPTPSPPPITPISPEEATSAYPRSILAQPTGSGSGSVSGHLSYTHRPLKSAYELRLDPGPDAYTESGDHATATPVALAEESGSSITFLPEGSASASSHQLLYATTGRSSNTVPPPPFRRGRSSLSMSHVPLTLTRNSTITGHSRLQNTLQPPLSLPKKSRVTNYVSLSRKSTFRKPSLFRSQSTPSSITGEFTIDPSLHIPSALLKAVAVESTLTLSTTRLPNDTAHQRVPKDEASFAPSSQTQLQKMLSAGGASKAKSPHTQHSGPETRRKNLFLEVENGGIDVDVHLVPSTSSSSSALYSTSIIDVASSLGRAHSRVRSRTSFSRRPSNRRSRSKAHEFESVDTLAGFGQLRRQRQGHYEKAKPTLIDLRLKPSELSRGGKARGKDFPLIARIHAPGPRPPFHVLASTMDMDVSSVTTANENKALPPLPPTNAPSPPLTPGTLVRNDKTIHHRRPLLTRPIPSLTHLSKSHLTLHIPRNFRGPLTVHVAAGNIDEHIQLSREVASSVVILSESAFMRGYYVGGLAGENEVEGEGDNEEVEDEDEEAEGEIEVKMVPSDGGHRDQSRIHGLAGGRDAASAAAAEDEEQEDEIYKIDRTRHLSLRTPHLNHTAGFAVSGDSEASRDIDDDDDNLQLSQEDEDEEWKGDKVDVVVGQGKIYVQFVDEYDPFGKQKFGFWKNLISGYYNR